MHAICTGKPNLKRPYSCIAGVSILPQVVKLKALHVRRLDVLVAVLRSYMYMC